MRGANEEDGRDAGGTDGKPENQEVEGVTCNIGGDADRACEGNARGERKPRPKNKEADAFEHIEDRGQREYVRLQPTLNLFICYHSILLI
ncbi:hypothetical protein NDU88_004217 [Pleurodeles waltl]|uniref:Uncharacterized protein n=1 Tax=Pleurodeles waltl TaxID=8319 RepID=A0AAV7UFH1_PLEWA|nr:hypothetical protein NDU88_004217 [Pleurodeles waltl]